MSRRKTPVSKAMPKSFAKERYRSACAEPFLWLVKAREMRRAADLVWTQFMTELMSFTSGEEVTVEPFTGSVAMMLYGFCIENLLKAGLVASGAAVLPNGNFGLDSHALEDLADELSVSLSEEERELMERLEHFISWAGRYPIPLYADALYPRDLLDGSKGVIYGLASMDQERVHALILRVQALLPTEEEALEASMRSRP